MNTEYNVDYEKKTVTAVMTCDEGRFIGTARCQPCDSFDVELGKQIAYKRALLQVKKYDINTFRKEINFMDNLLEKMDKVDERRKKVKKHLKTAKKQLSNIHKEIEKLSNISTTNKTELFDAEKNKDVFFKNYTKNGNGSRVQYIKIIDKISNFKSNVVIYEETEYVSKNFKQNTSKQYYDIISNDKLRDMEKISKEQFINETEMKSSIDTELFLKNFSLIDLLTKF